MNELNPFWRTYAHLQMQSRRHSCVDARAWGVDAGLDYLLASYGNDNGSRDRAVERAAELGKARERHRAKLRIKYCDASQISDPTALLDDHARLRGLLSRMSSCDRKILLAAGFGHNSEAIARFVSKTPAAVRQRIARLRLRNL
jgi:hypothetical protein